MTLLEEIRAKTIKHGPACAAGKALVDVEPAILAAIDEARAEDLPWTAIAAWLSDRHIAVSVNGLKRHHRGQCTCPR